MAGLKRLVAATLVIIIATALVIYVLRPNAGPGTSSVVGNDPGSDTGNPRGEHNKPPRGDHSQPPTDEGTCPSNGHGHGHGHDDDRDDCGPKDSDRGHDSDAKGHAKDHRNNGHHSDGKDGAEKQGHHRQDGRSDRHDGKGHRDSSGDD